MKVRDIILGMLVTIFVTSCAAHTNPADNISYGQALQHCASTGSYWLWIVLVGIVAITTGFFIYKAYQKDQEWSIGRTLICFALFALFMVAIFMRPAEVAANTTVEQAARGVFIGY